MDSGQELSARELADRLPGRRLKVFAVLDMKMKCFMQPFTSMNGGVASRMFQDSITGDSVIGKHPEDFALYELGEFDEQTGFLQSHVTPVSLGLAVQFMEVKRA